MPKLKTRKSISKRFKITKKKKVLKRTCGQDHFNSRESGKVKRNKRRPSKLGKSHQKNVKVNIPYH